VQDHLVVLKPDLKIVRITAIVAILAGLVTLWFSVRWQVGAMFADVTSGNDADAKAIAESAISLAPANPRGYWLSGSILRSAFDDASFAAAMNRFESAARVSPHHYGSWTELGRTAERAGDYNRAEAAFRKAIELAPEYTIPRWQIGNFYLRRGRIEDAVRELRLAARHTSPYQVQVFSTAWNVLGNDPRQVDQFLSDTEDSKATLAYFYGSINRPDDALRIWSQIDPANRPRFDWQIKALARDLLIHRSFRGALEFVRQNGVDTDARPEAFTNGDFESAIPPYDGVRFNWTINRIDGKIDAGTDNSTQRNGKRSLKFTLRGYPKHAFHTLQQSIAVVPGSRYRLSFWVRTENLRSGSMPFIEVRNAKDDSINMASPPFASGTSEWTQMTIDFAIAPDKDGIYVTTAREPCSGECPINGIFWLDDFVLTRLQ
jgi:tetratricopeptide (TPR) repeat protein